MNKNIIIKEGNTIMSTMCKFIKPNGEPCQAYTISDSDYCLWHSPEMIDKCKTARKKGGFHRHTSKAKTTRDPYTIQTVKDVMRILKDALNDAQDLENSQARARTIGYLCHIAFRGLEVSELEERLISLEERLKSKENTV